MAGMFECDREFEDVVFAWILKNMIYVYEVCF